MEDWACKETAGLAFDFVNGFVKLRDIHEDKEILADPHGEEQEFAGQAHVAAWQPPASAASYRLPWELDADIDSDLQTVEDIAST
jgi:hypothetical protein